MIRVEEREESMAGVRDYPPTHPPCQSQDRSSSGCNIASAYVLSLTLMSSPKA